VDPEAAVPWQELGQGSGSVPALCFLFSGRESVPVPPVQTDRKIPRCYFCLPEKRVLEMCRLYAECLIVSNLPVLSTPGLPATSPRPGHSREHNTADPG